MRAFIAEDPMDTTFFFTNASRLIDTAGRTAHSAIGAYRQGGERLAQVADQQWNESFRAARPRLTPETRRNAAHAKRVVGGYYSRGLDLSARRAATAVDTLLATASTLVARVAAPAGHDGKAG
jgi:hypothetical protein